MEAEPVKQIDDMSRQAHADAHVAEGVFQNQIPADDPGHEFAERGVGVSVGGAGDGIMDASSGVTEPGEDADNSHQHQRKGKRRSRAGPSCHGRVVDEVVQQRGIPDIRHIEFLAGHGGANDRENAGPNHRSDASAVSDQGPRDFFRECPGSCESRINLSMDLRATSCLNRAVLLIRCRRGPENGRALPASREFSG